MVGTAHRRLTSARLKPGAPDRLQLRGPPRRLVTCAPATDPRRAVSTQGPRGPVGGEHGEPRRTGAAAVGRSAPGGARVVARRAGAAAVATPRAAHGATGGERSPCARPGGRGSTPRPLAAQRPRQRSRPVPLSGRGRDQRAAPHGQAASRDSGPRPSPPGSAHPERPSVQRADRQAAALSPRHCTPPAVASGSAADGPAGGTAPGCPGLTPTDVRFTSDASGVEGVGRSHRSGCSHRPSGLLRRARRCCRVATGRRPPVNTPRPTPAPRDARFRAAQPTVA